MNDAAIVARWRARLAVRRALLATARAKAAYWRQKKARAAAGSADVSHAAAMLAERERLVAQRLAQVEEARRVIDRHGAEGVSERGVDFIKSFEGFSATIYDDGVHVRTIGYGTTEADVRPLPSHVSEHEAAGLLREKLDKKYAPPVLRALDGMHPTQNEIDACVSFSYNLGVGSFEGAPGFETLTRALKAHDRQRIADAFLLYDDPSNPKVHAGLKRRRNAEREIFLHGRYVA